MLDRALAKTGNLMTSMNSYPKGMILQFARQNPEKVREMFRSLFDESRDVIERIFKFKKESESLRLEYSPNAKNHFQDENTIVKYLWLKYPNKYYIYKIRELQAIASKLAVNLEFKQGRFTDNWPKFMALYDAIRDVLAKDMELRQLLKTQVSTDRNCYEDESLCTMTVDFGFFISRSWTKVDAQNQNADRCSGNEKQSTVTIPCFWKISHGRSASTGISVERKADCERRHVITMNRYTKGVSNSLITQGDQFLYSMRKGDFAYLCYASEIKYLVQIIDDEAVSGEFSDEWYERSYRVVKKAEKSQYPSNAPRKAWTPNHNSTLVRIDVSDLDEFDKFILKPHFNISTNEVIENAQGFSDKKFWFLIGNPKMWDMETLSNGDIRDYTIFNENGNARREYSAFVGCREGDILIGYVGAPKKYVCAFFECVKGSDKQRIYFKKILSLENVIDREDFIQDEMLSEMSVVKNPQGSLFAVTKEQFKKVVELAKERNPDIDLSCVEVEENAEGVLLSTSRYTKDDFLNEAYIVPEKYDSLVQLLKRKKNIILQGAPGVGKTYIAKRLAYSMMGERDESRIEMVQFHQNYSYDDFVRGYKPDETSFNIKDGIFYSFCKKALEHPTLDYFFIIDEINRGNVSKIFGELLMLIECDHRGETIKLSVGGDEFTVPENIYIIGMMNTADRSLALIDYALRRRFGFVDIEPGFKAGGFKRVCEKINNPKLDALIQVVGKLNSKIEKDSSLGKGFCIGHSYFCFNGTPCTDESLSCIVKHDILPMLKEYWFDDNDSYMEWEREFAEWEREFTESEGNLKDATE